MSPVVSPPVFRFAPSPNGLLHLGHGFSALLNADLARAAGGQLLLRIEDIDRARCRLRFETAIHDDLAWLGLAFEQPVRRQSDHMDAYRAALARLDAQGLIYPSFESRAALSRLATARDPDGAPRYDGAAKALPHAERRARMAAGEPYALRLDMNKALEAALNGALARNSLNSPLTLPLTWQEEGAGPQGETGTVAADPRAWGDVVLARKETPTSYHLSVVVDDALQGVTDIVRGHDLFHATSVHRLLQTLLGFGAPRYRHHRLIVDAAGAKLSKSTGATALAALRAAGATPQDIRAQVGL